jgi:hypothetical protein
MKAANTENIINWYKVLILVNALKGCSNHVELDSYTEDLISRLSIRVDEGIKYAEGQQYDSH